MPENANSLTWVPPGSRPPRQPRWLRGKTPPPAGQGMRRRKPSPSPFTPASGRPRADRGAPTQLRPTRAQGMAPGTPCRPAQRTNKHATQNSVCGGGTHRSTQRCVAGALARAAKAGRETVKRFPQGEPLDKPGWSARRGTGEQAAQATDTTRIINNNGTLSLRRNCEQWLGE